MKLETVTDVLMITYNRSQYTERSLSRLLATCDDSTRIWIWQNGSDPGTLRIVRELARHPRVHAFHHCPENKKLREPTNWFWSNADGHLLGKVDDDCLVPHGWVQTLRQAHLDEPRFGIIACWHFPEADFDRNLAAPKMDSFFHGHRLMKNLWVGGSGYLMKRRCLQEQGPLKPKQSFTDYCARLAAKGWINGWYYPLLIQDHMDDPRSPHTMLKSDADLARFMPLSASKNGVTTLDQWQAQLRRSAVLLQRAPYDPASRLGWRRAIAAPRRWMRRLAGVRGQW